MTSFARIISRRFRKTILFQSGKDREFAPAIVCRVGPIGAAGAPVPKNVGSAQGVMACNVTPRVFVKAVMLPEDAAKPVDLSEQQIHELLYS